MNVFVFSYIGTVRKIPKYSQAYVLIHSLTPDDCINFNPQLRPKSRFNLASRLVAKGILNSYITRELWTTCLSDPGVMLSVMLGSYPLAVGLACAASLQTEFATSISKPRCECCKALPTGYFVPDLGILHSSDPTGEGLGALVHTSKRQSGRGQKRYQYPRLVQPIHSNGAGFRNELRKPAHGRWQQLFVCILLR